MCEMMTVIWLSETYSGDIRQDVSRFSVWNDERRTVLCKIFVNSCVLSHVKAGAIICTMV